MLLSRMGMTEYSGRYHLAFQFLGDNATSLMESSCVQIIDYRASPASAATDEYHLCPMREPGERGAELP